MELSITLKWLPGSVVPIVTTTQNTTSDTPVNVNHPPTEVTRTTEKGGDREPSVDRWQGKYRGWRGLGGNRSWRGGNRSWRGGNRSWRGGNRGLSHGDGDEGVRHVGGGDRGRDGGAVHRERSVGGGNKERRGGSRDRTVGGVDRGRNGGAGNSGRHGKESYSIMAIDRVPLVGNVPSTSGGKATRAFKGQCTKCYEEGHRRKDCPYDVTYRLLTPELETSKSTK